MIHHSSVLHFSKNKQFWALFSCICYPVEGLLWRNACLGFLPNFWLGFLFLWYSDAWGACIFWRLIICQLLYFQFRSVNQSWGTLWKPMNTRLPVHHQLLEIIQTHVHWVSDVIQPSHPLLSPSPPAFNLSQHKGLFQWVSSFYQVAKVLELQLQHKSFQWIFRTDFL